MTYTVKQCYHQITERDNTTGHQAGKENDMKLKELVGIMNIADVGVASTTIPGFYCIKKIDMFHLKSDPVLEQYGEYEVRQLTNIAKSGDVIWID